jgi:hypothetical protein
MHLKQELDVEREEGQEEDCEGKEDEAGHANHANHAATLSGASRDRVGVCLHRDVSS